jgi:hypothetical protein
MPPDEVPRMILELLHLLATIPIALMMVGYPCCCDSGEVVGFNCDVCNGSGDRAPLQISATFTGIADFNTCTNCEVRNDTFILDQAAESSSNSCLWSIDTGDPVCPGVDNAKWIYVLIEATEIQVWLYGPPVALVFNGNFYSIHGLDPLDCLGLDSVNVPKNDNAPCDVSSATCEITAVAE